MAGSFSLTHPRNAGRKDLGCPFGCKEANRKQASSQRSAEYYRGQAGKLKKRIQNGKRKALMPSQPERASAPWKAPMVEHVRMVSSLIEGRRVSRKEIWETLERVLRQHTIGQRKRIDHAIAWLHENPP